MWKRLLVLGLLVVVAVVASGLAGVYWAVTTAQPFYQQALEQDPVEQQTKSQELESRFTTLHSDLQSQGEWRTAIAADEINAWLATKLPESFPNMLPEQVREPRIAISAEEVKLAALSDVSGVETVLSVAFEPFVTDDGDLAIELRQVLAGALPMPSQNIVQRLAIATKRMNLPIHWTQNQGNAVMVLERRLWDTESGENRVLNAIELAEGELFLTGYTELIEPAAAVANESATAPVGAASDSSTPANTAR